SPSEQENGRECFLVLENSPFFPGGGGQPADRGTIAGFEIGGISRVDNLIGHRITGGENLAGGEEVECTVDMDFRRDSRQQHTGQHLISAALAEYGIATVSVHLGNEYCGIEVDAVDVENRIIDRVLSRSDEWIQEDRPVRSRYLSQKEVEELPLRRPSKKKVEGGTGPVRVVDIEDVDVTGCGGVHLSRTGQLRFILFEGAERIRGRIRLKWIIGDRAVTRARSASDRQDRLNRLLSCEDSEVVERAGSILEELKVCRTSLIDSEQEMGRLYGEKISLDSENPVLQIGGGMERLNAAADAAACRGASSVFFVGGTTPNGDFPWILYRRNPDPNFFSRFKETVFESTGGKGGGNPPVWRGRIIDAKKALSAVRNLLTDT
ncbi:MAG: alanyl-tRNA editing protein, partial [Spirochaetaceae bacterium]|nr:alanyl-tRNA editing protein [Spirochaetaceae bacterium]